MPRPDGLVYKANFLSVEDERELLDYLVEDSATWNTAGPRANRVVKHYGYNYPYSRKLELTLAEPIPPIIVKIIQQLRTIPELRDFEPDQAIINRYLTGEGISKHIDHTELFGDTVVSVSIGCSANMRFRKDNAVHDQTVQRRSLYAMQRAARYEWTHEMCKSKAQCSTRFSITFRQVNIRYLKKGQTPHAPVPIPLPLPAPLVPAKKIKVAMKPKSAPAPPAKKIKAAMKPKPVPAPPKKIKAVMKK